MSVDLTAVRATMRTQLRKQQELRDLPTVWHGRPWKEAETPDVAHLRETFFVAGEPVVANDLSEVTGEQRVSVFVPKNAEVEEAERLQKLVADQMRPNKNLQGTGVEITLFRTARRTVFEKGKWLIAPVSVFWRTYAKVS